MFAVLLVVAFSVWGSSMAQNKAERLTVSVEVFSGRPNPTYDITDPGEINRLKDNLSNLPAVAMTGDELMAFGRLGYRGILIRNPAGIAGIPPYVQILEGKVKASFGPKGADSTFFMDTEDLEKRYLGMAKDKGLISPGLFADNIVPDPDAM